jgi:hypothetical protein
VIRSFYWISKVLLSSCQQLLLGIHHPVILPCIIKFCWTILVSTLPQINHNVYKEMLWRKHIPLLRVLWQYICIGQWNISPPKTGVMISVEGGRVQRSLRWWQWLQTSPWLQYLFVGYELDFTAIRCIKAYKAYITPWVVKILKSYLNWLKCLPWNDSILQFIVIPLLRYPLDLKF